MLQIRGGDIAKQFGPEDTVEVKLGMALTGAAISITKSDELVPGPGTRRNELSNALTLVDNRL
eukprot:1179107-Prorocentrum_minimum.AAC.5